MAWPVRARLVEDVLEEKPFSQSERESRSGAILFYIG